MRTYKYKIQHHKRNKHIASDVRIITEVYNHFVALTKRHFNIYGECEGYKRASYSTLSAHLTKLKKQPKYRHWNTPYSWALQQTLRRLEFGYDRFFNKLAKRPPKFKKYRNYKSQTFDGKQCPVEVLDKAGGCPVAKVRLNGRWHKFWYSRPIQGTVKRVTVKKDIVGDWYVTFTTDDKGLDPESKTGIAAGFDFGLKTFLTCSDGSKYQSPEFYKSSINAIKKAHRAVSTPICHQCGHRTDIELQVRQWSCANCNSNHDRDVNAAINIAQVGASTYSGGGITLAIASCLSR